MTRRHIPEVRSGALALRAALLATSMIALAAASAASAQDAAPAGQAPVTQQGDRVDPANPSPTETPRAAAPVDGDIVVTARRREESLQNVPVAVTAIGGATLAKYAVSDITQIAQLVPSMVVGRQASGSSASIFLRGVGSTSLSSGFDQSVSLNQDGLAMSRGKELLTSQYDLARVEVLKGPQALFFGKNSTGGVITLTSADPTDRFELDAKMGYEFQSRELYGDFVVSGPLTDKLSARFAFHGSSEDGPFYNTAQDNALGGLYRHVPSDRRGASDTKAGRLTLKYVNPDFVNIVLKASLSMVDDDSASALYERQCAAGRTTPRPTGGVAEVYADCTINGRSGFAAMPYQIAQTTPYARDGMPYTDYDAYTVALTIDKSFGPVTLTSVTGQYGFRQQDLQSAAGSTAGIYFTQYNKFRQTSEELRASTNFDFPVNLTAGAFYATTHYVFNTAAQAAAIITPSPINGTYLSFIRNNGIDGESISAFAELKWNVIPTVELAGGARYTDETKDSFAQNVLPGSAAFPVLPPFVYHYHDTNVSPQVTLTWKPTADITLYGAYKRGFKAGGFNTSISILATSKERDGEFAAEKADGFEAGLRTQFFDRQVRFNVTAYDYNYRGLQVQVFDPITTGSRVANAGRLSTKGVEAELYFRPRGSGFEAHASGAYNRAVYHDYIGSCYGGQTIAEGCAFTPGASGAFNNQNYDGRTSPKAPRFAGRAGGSYEAAITPAVHVGVSADVTYSAKYNYTDTLRPDGVQGRYAKLDLGARVFNPSDGWELALIGRNLTNRFVVTSANDMPGQGAGGTGTAVGVRSDLNTIVDRPRAVFVQASKKF